MKFYEKCSIVFTLFNAIGSIGTNAVKSAPSPFKNHYCKAKGDYVFTLWTEANETRLDFTFNFVNKQTNDRLKYQIDYHSKFAVIDQDTPNTKCVTIIADELFKKLKQDISTPSIAINGQFSLTVHTETGIESSPAVPIKDILRQRLSEKRKKSEASKTDKSTNKNANTHLQPQRTEPALKASFIRHGVIDNPSHYAFELMINDHERPLHSNSVDLIFETNNWKSPPNSFNLFPKNPPKLEWTIQETQMSYIMIFEVRSLLQYLIDNVYPRDMLLTTGSIRLVVSPRGDNDANHASVGFTSEAVQVSDLGKNIGVTEEQINELHSIPDAAPKTKWEIAMKLTQMVLILVGSVVIALHVLNLST